MPYESQPYIYQSDEGAVPEAPRPANWFVKNKRVLLIAGGCVAFIVVILFVVLFFVNRHKANQAINDETVKQTQAVAIATAKCADSKNPDKCNASVQPNLAGKTGKVSYCVGLTGNAYDDCAALAAMTAKSLDDCGVIQNPEKKSDCTMTVTAMLTPIVAKISPDVQTAVDTKNPDLCATITDENDRSICFELVGVGDRDHDGLDAAQEANLGTSDANIESDGDGLTDADEVNVYHTNPALADTDGDGYSDGIEVKTGYNPLGPGKL